MLKGFVFDTPIEMEVFDVKNGTIFENEDFFIESRELNRW